MSGEQTYLPNSSWCFVCGEDNEAGLQTRFYVEDDAVKARLRFRPEHCGYADRIHGGVIVALVDEAMGWAAARKAGRMFVTAELVVRYLKPVPTGHDLIISAQAHHVRKRMARATGVACDEAGEVYIQCKGRFLPLSEEESLKVDDMLIYRGGEERIFDAVRAARYGAGA